jgi:cysteinyl-tRNA synthetase
MLRYFLLSTHYRSPLDFSDQALEEAKRTLDGFYDLFKRLGEVPSNAYNASNAEEKLSAHIQALNRAFEQGMDDDFNSPAALAALQDFRGEINRLLEDGLSIEARMAAREAFRSVGKVLCLFQLSEWRFNSSNSLSIGVKESIDVDDMAQLQSELPDDSITIKLDERNAARRRKDFKRADEIRTELAALGITIEDRPDGTSRWKR